MTGDSGPGPVTPVPQPGGSPPAELFPTRLLLIRHGRSADYIPGEPWTDDPPLHEIGHAQAKALATRLEPVAITAVYSSPFERAYRTAAYSAERHGLDVVVIDELQEVHLGDWSGGEYRRRAASGDPEFQVHLRTGRWDDVPGAERDADFRARVTGAVDRIVADGHVGNVLVVCHSGVINAYLAELLGIGPSRVGLIENTSISLVHAGPGGRVIASLNDHVHLGEMY